ncbi:MAG TPA: type IX secretion system protein PorQ [Bacteroides sp.]|nr:type IX secretion system protein PorQ [Bacteroides sp.]
MFRIPGFSTLFLLLVLANPAMGQLGGNSTYAFLNLTHSARIAALGGKIVSIPDNDLNLSFHNPSALHEGMSNQLILNYVNYFSDINFGYVSYARSYEGIGNFAAGLNYINYGTFIAADHLGNVTGEFRAAEYALNLIYSRALDSLFTVGVNVKPVYSVLETYHSFGLLADLGVTYTNRDKLFSAGLVLRNAGFQVKPYHSGHREPVPFEILLGFSQKLRHAPFRFSIVAHNLQKLDLTYDDPSQGAEDFDPISGEPIPENKWEKLADNTMRHLIFGVEFIPLENFYLRAGYNYQRRQELKISSRTAMVGFSWGFGIRISKFHLNYGRASYHLAGASNHFSITTDLSSFSRN